jgi:hypothetical protein
VLNSTAGRGTRAYVYRIGMPSFSRGRRTISNPSDSSKPISITGLKELLYTHGPQRVMSEVSDSRVPWPRDIAQYALLHMARSATSLAVPVDPIDLRE